MRGDQTAAWQDLTQQAKAFAGFDLRDAFASDAQRATHFSQEAPGVFADLSKNHWDARVEAQLLALAQQAGVELPGMSKTIAPQPTSLSLPGAASKAAACS